MLDNLTVVIRAAGERTELACQAILADQIADKYIFILHEVPFSKAVRRNFEIGIAENKQWTLAVDADILLAKGALNNLIKNVEKLDKKTLDKLFVYQGNVLCKVLGRPRQAGFHLYQTKFLEKAITYIPTEKTAIRPESATYSRMLGEGCYHFIDDKIYGVHDYEQFSKDMFRNGYLQSRKHFYLTRPLMKLWGENAEKDTDYELLLQGWIQGLIDPELMQIDKIFFNKKVDAIFPKLGLKEKENLPFSKVADLYELVAEAIRVNGPYILKNRRKPLPEKSLVNRIKSKIGYQIMNIGKSIVDSSN